MRLAACRSVLALLSAAAVGSGSFVAREWAYDRESHVGKLDKGLDEAKAKGWTIVDMKTDWKRIYPFDT